MFWDQTTYKMTWQEASKCVAIVSLVLVMRLFVFGLYQVPTGSMEITMLVGERFLADKISLWFRAPYRGEIIAFNDTQYVYSSNVLLRFWQKYVWGPTHLAKRIIGVPGDRVRGTIEGGKPIIYVNEVRLEEPYLNPYPLLGLWKEEQVYTVVSYDPILPYQQQKLYQIDPNKIVYVKGKNTNAYLMGLPAQEFTVTDDGRMLLLPGVASTHQWSGGSDEFYVQLGPDEFWVMGDNRRGSTDSRLFGPIKDPHALIRWRIWSHDSDEVWWIWDLIKHPIDFWTRMRWSRFFNVLL